MSQKKQDLLGFIILAIFSFGFYPMMAATSIAFVAATFDQQSINYYEQTKAFPNRQVLELVAWTNVKEKVSIQFWMKDPNSGATDPTMKLYVMYKEDPWTYESHRYKSILDLPKFVNDWCRVVIWRAARLFWSTLAA